MSTQYFISESEVAQILGKSVITLRNWRSKALSYGPPFFKIGHNVRYRRADIDAWIERQIVDPADRDRRIV